MATEKDRKRKFRPVSATTTAGESNPGFVEDLVANAKAVAKGGLKTGFKPNPVGLALKATKANPVHLAEVNPGATPKPKAKESKYGGYTSPVDFFIRPAHAGQDMRKPNEGVDVSPDGSLRFKPRSETVNTSPEAFQRPAPPKPDIAGLERWTPRLPGGTPDKTVGTRVGQFLGTAASGIKERTGDAVGKTVDAVKTGNDAASTFIGDVLEGAGVKPAASAFRGDEASATPPTPIQGQTIPAASASPAGKPIAPISTAARAATGNAPTSELTPPSDVPAPTQNKIRKTVGFAPDGRGGGRKVTSFEQVGGGTVTHQDVIKQFGGTPIGEVGDPDTTPENAKQVTAERAAENRRLAKMIGDQRLQFIADERAGFGDTRLKEQLAAQRASEAETASVQSKARSDRINAAANAANAETNRFNAQRKLTEAEQKQRDANVKRMKDLASLRKSTAEQAETALRGYYETGNINRQLYPTFESMIGDFTATIQQNPIALAQSVGIDPDPAKWGPTEIGLMTQFFVASRQSNREGGFFTPGVDNFSTLGSPGAFRRSGPQG